MNHDIRLLNRIFHFRIGFFLRRRRRYQTEYSVFGFVACWVYDQYQIWQFGRSPERFVHGKWAERYLGNLINNTMRTKHNCKTQRCHFTNTSLYLQTAILRFRIAHFLLRRRRYQTEYSGWSQDTSLARYPQRSTCSTCSARCVHARS